MVTLYSNTRLPDQRLLEIIYTVLSAIGTFPYVAHPMASGRRRTATWDEGRPQVTVWREIFIPRDKASTTCSARENYNAYLFWQ